MSFLLLIGGVRPLVQASRATGIVRCQVGDSLITPKVL
jgi:hypothetical protein